MVSWKIRLLWVIVICFLFAPAAQAQATPVVRCRLQASQLAPGDETQLAIEVQDVTDFFGYQLRLNYPPELLEILDNDPNSEGVNLALGDFLSPDFVVANQADNATGTISLAAVQINPSPPKSGSGELALVSVRAKAEGAINFAFDDVILSDSQGRAIPHNLEGCALQVNPASLSATTVPPPAATATQEAVLPSDTPLPTATSAPEPALTPTPLPPTEALSMTPTEEPVALQATSEPVQTSTVFLAYISESHMQAVVETAQSPTPAMTATEISSTASLAQPNSTALLMQPSSTAILEQKAPAEVPSRNSQGVIWGVLVALLVLALLAWAWRRFFS